ASSPGAGPYCRAHTTSPSPVYSTKSASWSAVSSSPTAMIVSSGRTSTSQNSASASSAPVCRRSGGSQRGAPDGTQSTLHPSPSIALPSSQSSPGSVISLPHSGIGMTDVEPSVESVVDELEPVDDVVDAAALVLVVAGSPSTHWFA